MPPLIQLALDTLNLQAALELAHRLDEFIDIVEAGTPFIKREGMIAVSALREHFPRKLILADTKTFDSAAFEANMAFDAGADMITVLGCAADSTILAAIATANARGRKVVVDVVGVRDKVERALQLEAMGAHYLAVHAREDVTPRALPHDDLRAIVSVVRAPIVIAGGITPENVSEVLMYQPAVIVAGSAITRAEDARSAALRLLSKVANFNLAGDFIRPLS